MFSNKRYITSGINSQIEPILQLYIWNLIDTMQIYEKDYLQIFKLSCENGKQSIQHIQEQPPYEQHYLVESTAPITAKIYVIDDETHSTMLLAEEY